MDSTWNTALWSQFGAAIDMLHNALVACPDSLWTQRLWPVPSDPEHPLPPELAEFWYVAYHTLFWLDLYLSGSEEGFAPPAPFTLSELDPAGAIPERVYTREELRSYLAATRQKGHATLIALTDEQARRPIEGRAFNFLELQMYNMRHVQEHAAQLSLFLGQHGTSPSALDWVPRAR